MSFVAAKAQPDTPLCEGAYCILIRFQYGLIPCYAGWLPPTGLKIPENTLKTPEMRSSAQRSRCRRQKVWLSANVK